MQAIVHVALEPSVADAHDSLIVQSAKPHARAEAMGPPRLSTRSESWPMPEELSSHRAAPPGRLVFDRYRCRSLTRVTYKFYPQARHELLNETNPIATRCRTICWRG